MDTPAAQVDLQRWRRHLFPDSDLVVEESSADMLRLVKDMWRRLCHATIRESVTPLTRGCWEPASGPVDICVRNRACGGKCPDSKLLLSTRAKPQGFEGTGSQLFAVATVAFSGRPLTGFRMACTTQALMADFMARWLLLTSEANHTTMSPLHSVISIVLVRVPSFPRLPVVACSVQHKPAWAAAWHSGAVLTLQLGRGCTCSSVWVSPRVQRSSMSTQTRHQSQTRWCSALPFVCLPLIWRLGFALLS